MSAAIPEHGYREFVTIVPRCKCGWVGTKVTGSDVGVSARASESFERHKTSVRHRLASPEHPGSRVARREGPRMSTCRSCGAEVVFVPSATSGKAIILDAKPEKRVVILGEPISAVPSFISGGDPTAIGQLGKASVVSTWTDHHVTCPDAASWKGKRR